MVQIKTMPKDTAAEVLRYLAEYEEFQAVEKLVGSDLAVGEVRAVLRELAAELEHESFAEGKASFDVKSCKTLSKSSKNIISCLSSREEKSLLSAFGLIENPAQQTPTAFAGKK